MYQTGRTIKQTLDQIHKHDLVLPAIQREFVWGHDQICSLFDSLMQGYPFGAFLYWQIEPENSGKFKYYDFVRDYHERDNPHCPPLADMPNQKLTAVLDGQQRLTALNIGLRGTMAWKLPYYKWSSDHAYPARKLHLDLLWQPDKDDEVKYHFDFLTDYQYSESGNSVFWFPVADILTMKEVVDVNDWLLDNLSSEQVETYFKTASRTLFRLFQVVHTEKILAYYEEREQDIEKVLQIFIRTNSGGTILSYSDLLLSVAVAQWDDHDAREEIHGLVDELNKIGAGFTFSKDLVLKAGLMLSDIGSVGFKVENFNKANMDVFESKWDAIVRALTLCVRLISDFGFNWRSLRAHNAILPIAYYLYLRNHGNSYLTHNKFKDDRRAVREFLIRSLLKSGIWGGSSDTLLTALRQIIRDNSDSDHFPAQQIYVDMNRRGRSLGYDDEEIEDLADMQYGDPLTFALLSLLFPFVDLRNHFHIDHIFPRARFTRTRLTSACVPDNKIDDFIQSRDGLANLQLLEGTQNLEKSAKMPAEWLSETYSNLTDRQAYQGRHLLGEVPASIIKFDKFYDARRERLKSEIKLLLGRHDNPA